MGSDGRPKGSGEGAAEGKQASDAGHEENSEGGRSDTDVEGVVILPNAVNVEIKEAKKQRVGKNCDSGIEAFGEGLLDQAAKQDFFPDGIQEHSWQRKKSKEAQGREEPAQFLEVKVVSNADAPAVRRVTVDCNAEEEEDEAGGGSSKGAEEHGRGGDAVRSEADLVTAGPRKEQIRRGP